MTRYVTWHWSNRIHIAVPEPPAPEPLTVPTLPTSDEVWAAVLGPPLTTWCGVLKDSRELGRAGTVTDVVGPAPEHVCQNCQQALAAGKPVPARRRTWDREQHHKARTRRAAPSSSSAPTDDAPVNDAAVVVPNIGTRGTGGRYVWRGRKQGQ